MTIAVCVKCGATKFGALTPCKECRQMPETEQEVIYSVALSDHFLDVEKLKEIARSIKNGQYIRLTAEQEELLRPEAREYLKMYAPMIAGAKKNAGSRGENIRQTLRDRNDPVPSHRLRRLAAGQDPSSVYGKNSWWERLFG